MSRAAFPTRRFSNVIRESAPLCLLVVACAGPQFNGQRYENEELSFELREVPREWRQVEAEGPLLVFRDDAAMASVAVNGRCGNDGDDVPLVSLTHHLFLSFTERNVESQQALMLDEREALHTELTAKLDGVPKRFNIVVLKKNGCVYDFIHVADSPDDKASRDRFLSFVRGFSTIAP